MDHHVICNLKINFERPVPSQLPYSLYSFLGLQGCSLSDSAADVVNSWCWKTNKCWTIYDTTYLIRFRLFASKASACWSLIRDSSYRIRIKYSPRSVSGSSILSRPVSGSSILSGQSSYRSPTEAWNCFSRYDDHCVILLFWHLGLKFHGDFSM